MGLRVFPLIGPRSSMGSPVTFMMRPRVPAPTGTVMGPPVSFVEAPRTRPSVPANTSACGLGLFVQLCNLPSIAIQRTTFSPKCCCRNPSAPNHSHQSRCYRKLTATSKISFCPPLSVSRAFRIGGKNSESNFTVKRAVSKVNCDGGS